jgi:hypothetical protein
VFHPHVARSTAHTPCSNEEFVLPRTCAAPPRHMPREQSGGHDFGRIPVHAAPAFLQRKTDPAAPPKYTGCDTGTVLESEPHKVLERARVFARDLVDSALAAIERNDKSEPYRTALARHFLNPSFEQLKDIHRSFRMIWFHLRPDNIRCAKADEEKDECSSEDGGAVTGFIDGSTMVVCPSFWAQSLHCKAMTLIHEAAHGRGIGMGSPHPPYRGTSEYPSLAGTPSAGQTAEKRAGNPDAFSYFAAHIGRGGDTGCPSIPIDAGSVIMIEEKAPAPPPGKK